MLSTVIDNIIGRNVPGSQLYGAVLVVSGITLVIIVVKFLVDVLSICLPYTRKRRFLRIAKDGYARFEKSLFAQIATSPDEHQEKRQKIMSSFLSSQNWTMVDVSELLISPSYMSRDSDGWLIPNCNLCGKLEIEEFKGFMIDFNQSRPSIKILFKPATNGNGLLSFDDIYTILNLCQDEAESITFSLDPPPESASVPYHPFNAMRYKPTRLQNSNIMQTLFHADYLLKFFTTGMEVSAKPPFHQRPILDNLVKHLPLNLLQAIQPPFMRRLRFETGVVIHRFWIELKKLTYSTEVSKNKTGYFIEEINMNVKCERMKCNSSGQLCSTYSADRGEIDFANDFTSHYDELSKYFPILARLREISKLQFLQNMILKELKELQEDRSSKARFRALNSEIAHLRSLNPLSLPSPEACNWVPSAYLFCDSCRRYHGVYGGVTLKPMYQQCTNKTTTPFWSLQHCQPNAKLPKSPSSYEQYYSSAGGSVDIPKNETLSAAKWSDAQQKLSAVHHLSDVHIPTNESTPAANRSDARQELSTIHRPSDASITPKYSVHIPKNESTPATKRSGARQELSTVHHLSDSFVTPKYGVHIPKNKSTPAVIQSDVPNSHDAFTSNSIAKYDGGIRFNTNSGHNKVQPETATIHSNFVWAKLGNISECNTTHNCKTFDDRDDQSNESENNIIKDSNSSQTLYAHKDVCVVHRFSAVRRREMILTLDQIYAILTRPRPK